MRVYFITRFSIYDPSFRGFRLSTDNNSAEYERQLFSAERMEHKFRIFELNTLPSLLGQTDPDWEWLIYTSDRLPQQHLDRLRRLVSGHQNIKIFQVGTFREFFDADKSYPYQSPFATIRLDDDDGLTKHFVERVKRYEAHSGSVISFTEGRKVKLEDGKLVVGSLFSEKNNAQGMVGIDLRIYGCGSHSNMDARYKVVYDTTPEMFYIDCSPFADTKRPFTALGRVLQKLQRMLIVAVRRPSELPQEFATPIRKLLGRRP